jgi:hypothetical protein
MRQDAGAQAAARASARHAQGLGHGRDCDWPGAEGRVETLCVKQHSNDPACDGMGWDGMMGQLLLLRCTRPAMLLPCAALP